MPNFGKFLVFLSWCSVPVVHISQCCGLSGYVLILVVLYKMVRYYGISVIENYVLVKPTIYLTYNKASIKIVWTLQKQYNFDRF